jgi:nucleoside-diphosphate-sugar epimerase
LIELRVLIFGSSGFVGLRLVEILTAEGDEVYGFVRSPASAKMVQEAGAKPVSGDVLNPKTVDDALTQLKPDAAVFAAGERYPAGRVGDDYLDLMQRSRVEGSKNVLESIRKNSASVKFVTVSGALTYRVKERYKGEGREFLSVEKDEIDASTWFGDTLRKWESVVQDYVQSGVNASIIRLGAVYGWGGVWRERFFAPMCEHRRVTVPGNGRFTLSLIHVVDAARAIAHVLRRASAGEVYNAVDDEPVQFKVFIEQAAELFGAPAPRYVPMALVRVAFGSAFKLVGPAFSVSQEVSNEKIKKFGFDFMYPTYKKGLEQVKEEAYAKSGPTKSAAVGQSVQNVFTN